ncbi:SbcC/MukB-like Walker B domain-containing protein [Bacillota bacterium]
MKQIKKLLLIHWHYFNFEVVDFEKINFLTGKNASGKSTMIDALQLLLLGDANGRHFFNKAANEKSARSLKGYLRGELGDDGDVGFRYLRDGRFSSYIAAEFYDDVRNVYFTLGIVFDCYDDGSDEHRFFVIDAPIPDNCFVVNSTPLTYKELRAYVNKNYQKGKYDFPDSDRAFQEILKGKLGGLKNKYFSLFKKAVSFTPITDIETFITEYVCDVKSPVDISLMQDNIRYYKRMEYEADLMEARVSDLQAIRDKYGSYLDEKQRREIQSFIIDRARLQSVLDEKTMLHEQLEELALELSTLSKQQAEEVLAIAQHKNKRDKLKEDKLKSDIHNKMEQLTARKNQLTDRINELHSKMENAIQKLRAYAYEWRETSRSCKDLPELPQGEMKDALQARVDEVKDYAIMAGGHAKNLLDIDANGVGEFTERRFEKAIEEMSFFKQSAAGLLSLVEDRTNSYKFELEKRKKTLVEHEKGIKDYDPKLILLRDEIKKQLTASYEKEIEVYILADMIEIKDQRWRKAVEAYLHTQKFYLIVEPQYFIEALKVYDKLKFKMEFYDWGIVDTGKLEKSGAGAETGSLAEEVVTGNIYARQFIDYVMGRVIKCDNVEDLRKYGRAITDSCMLYQSYVARQLNPERWKYPYIGRHAIREQMERVKSFIAKAEEHLEVCRKLEGILHNVSSLSVINQNEAEYYGKIVEDAVILPELEKRRDQTIEEMGKLDLTWLLGLDRQIEECEAEIQSLEEEDKKYTKSISVNEEKQNTIKTEKLPGAEEKEKENRLIIELNYETDWVTDKGELRFQRELQARQSAKEVLDNFGPQLERTKSQEIKKKDDLELARSEYNREYKMSYDIKKADNSAYDKELEELKDIKLPGYRQQIKDAKEKAFQQFGDDFLAKLKANIDMVKTQINELNSALKESSWGDERYRFTWAPKAEYRRYYDMITDDMLLAGYNIASQLFRDKHRDSIDELFRQIIDVDNELNADARMELEKNIKRFTDYRTYLGFDLVVTDSEDRSQRLSRTLQKKSGGETQTPFYISVLASFAQLYRIQDPSYNRIRLIVFDEAFSKMDSERIQESIRLLKRFGFQCILSAPPEKIGDIAPYVDRNLCVIRNRTTAIIRAFDPKKLLEEGADEL